MEFRLVLVEHRSLNQLAADFQGIMSGETSVDEGLKEAEDYANGLLDEYWANK